MRAAVYDRFWHSQGGGERHCAMVGVVLARDGIEVDLITHQDLDKDALAEHLGLDLSGVGVRLVPDKGDHEVAVVSGDYDLFVNGSYMSRLAPRARRNAYLCYFPTPFDADLTPWRRTLIRALGRHVRARAGAAPLPGPGAVVESPPSPCHPLRRPGAPPGCSARRSCSACSTPS